MQNMYFVKMEMRKNFRHVVVEHQKQGADSKNISCMTNNWYFLNLLLVSGVLFDFGICVQLVCYQITDYI